MSSRGYQWGIPNHPYPKQGTPLLSPWLEARSFTRRFDKCFVGEKFRQSLADVVLDGCWWKAEHFANKLCLVHCISAVRCSERSSRICRIISAESVNTVSGWFCLICSRTWRNRSIVSRV